MALIGNILWLIFGGLLSGCGYILGGLLMCLTIVGIPFGLQSIKLGVATFTPFGRTVVQREDAGGCVRLGFDIIWLILFGWEIALVHIIHAVFLSIIIIGIPFAWQHLKLVPMSLLPLGRDLRKIED